MGGSSSTPEINKKIKYFYMVKDDCPGKKCQGKLYPYPGSEKLHCNACGKRVPAAQDGSEWFRNGGGISGKRKSKMEVVPRDTTAEK
eukprot:g48945.t1